MASARAWLLAVLLLPPCTGSLHQTVDDLSFAARHPAPGVRVAVGGRAVHVHCTGQGSPTLVLTHGLGGNALAWEVARAHWASEHRVCAWDRPGAGWSDPSPTPGASASGDALEAVLDHVAGEGGVVLVGHSYASFVFREHLATPDPRVLGVVLADPAHPAQLDDDCVVGCLPAPMPAWFRTLHRLTPWLARGGPLRLLVMSGAMPLPGVQHAMPDDTWWTYRLATLQTKAVDAASAEALSWGAVGTRTASLPDLGDLPLAIVSAEDPFGSPPSVTAEQVRRAWSVLQDDLTAWSRTSRREVVPQADHNALLTTPEGVEALDRALAWVVERAR